MSRKLTSNNSPITVTHENWVHRNQLKLGMYVLELDKPWEQTPFLFQGFYLDTPELIEEVQMESEYVLVQQQKSAFINRHSANRLCGAASARTATPWKALAR